MAASTPPLRVAVWDARRGDKEGREQEKMLCYYPSSIPVTSQINHVGFAQACAMFAEHFADGVGGSDGASCAGVPAGAERGSDPAAAPAQDQESYSIEADAHRWTVACCEPDIWFLLVGVTCRRCRRRCWLAALFSSSCDSAMA